MRDAAEEVMDELAFAVAVLVFGKAGETEAAQNIVRAALEHRGVAERVRSLTGGAR